MHVGVKSDRLILPMKRPNSLAAVAGRALVKGNSVETTAVRTRSRVAVSSGLDAVCNVARRDKEAGSRPCYTILWSTYCAGVIVI